MATGGVANGVTVAQIYSSDHRRRPYVPTPLPPAGPATGRHVAGRVARKKADRPPGHYPRFDLGVVPEQSGGKMIR